MLGTVCTCVHGALGDQGQPARLWWAPRSSSRLEGAGVRPCPKTSLHPSWRTHLWVSMSWETLGRSPGLEPGRINGLSLGDPLGMALECHPPRPHPWKGRRRYSLGVLAWPLQPADRGACSRWRSGAPSPSPGTRQGKRPPRVALAWPLSPRTGRDLRFSNPPPRPGVALRCPSPTSRPGKGRGR